MLSAEAEIQYVALRNINLIIQGYPEVLQYEIKYFSANTMIYLGETEKLETMVKLAAEQNIDQVLLEFKEYATEVDVDFVRKSVRRVKIAISSRNAAGGYVFLLELIGTRVNYVVQEAIVVIKDIFRRYPNQYEGVIGALCDSLETLDEPEAKASMVWIIGKANSPLSMKCVSYSSMNIPFGFRRYYLKMFVPCPLRVDVLAPLVLT